MQKYLDIDSSRKGKDMCWKTDQRRVTVKRKTNGKLNLQKIHQQVCMLSTGGCAEPICRCGDRSLSAVTKWLQLGNTRRMLVKVLQGSVFGPKLLTIHCIFATHHLKYDMYADDTQLYVDFPQNQPCHAEIAIRRIEGCTTDINRCMTSHQLLLNET